MANELPQRTKHVTIKDVAERAGTSTATVSYVLNNVPGRYVTEDLRQRVTQAAEELNYIKSSLASSLKGKKTGVIAVLTPQFENHFFARVFSSIEDTANRNGYVITTLNTFDDPALEKEALERLIRVRADGYIVIPTTGGSENTRYIREHKLPFVSVERPLDGADDKYDLITSDNLGATFTLTQHMLEHNHRNIALAYWESEVSTRISNLRERHKGYVTALESHGLEFDPSLVFKGDITHEEGARITKKILENPSVTAIVYAHYILAEGGIKYLRKNRIRVPEDISVAFLGAPRWVEMCETDYTHMVQPGEEMGTKAAEILFARIGGETGSFIRQVIPSTLHLGESVKTL